MKNLFSLFLRIMATIAWLLTPDSVKVLTSEEILLKRHLLVTEQFAGAIRREYLDLSLFWIRLNLK
jgi:hypothetical protein